MNMQMDGWMKERSPRLGSWCQTNFNTDGVGVALHFAVCLIYIIDKITQVIRKICNAEVHKWIMKTKKRSNYWLMKSVTTPK